MDAERARALLLELPYVEETMQWGNNLVFWVGDKAIGGRMLAGLNRDGEGRGVASFAAGPERFAELLELEGLRPAPYMARIFWVAAERWDAFRDRQWEAELRAAHQRTLEKLRPKTRALLALAAAEQRRLIAEHREALEPWRSAGLRAAAKKAPRNKTGPTARTGMKGNAL